MHYRLILSETLSFSRTAPGNIHSLELRMRKNSIFLRRPSSVPNIRNFKAPLAVCVIIPEIPRVKYKIIIFIHLLLMSFVLLLSIICSDNLMMMTMDYNDMSTFLFFETVSG